MRMRYSQIIFESTMDVHRLYHGSPYSNIEQFRLENLRHRTGTPGTLSFTTSIETAKIYGKYIYAADISGNFGDYRNAEDRQKNFDFRWPATQNWHEKRGEQHVLDMARQRMIKEIAEGHYAMWENPRMWKALGWDGAWCIESGSRNLIIGNLSCIEMVGKVTNLKEFNTSSPRFTKWFGDSKIVDGSGQPLKLYRGLYGPYAVDPTSPEGEWHGPRKGYAAFFSTSPHLASTYANIDDGIFKDTPHNIGAVYPVYIKADVLHEFPVKVDSYGYRRFDMFEFDRRAQRLKPGEAIVVRQVVDPGPRGTTKTDPDRLYSRPADVYAIGNGTAVRSAVSL